MSPVDWAMRPLKRYAQFSGRAPRAEFWWFFLFTMIIYLIVWFVILGAVGGLASSQTEPTAGILGAFGAGAIFIVLFWLALLIPTIAVQVRRVHDLNRSGWWIGGFYALYAVYMATTFGTVFAAAGAADPSQVNVGSMIGTMILGLAFMIYAIALLVFFCLPGTKGPNRYGEDPYGSNLGEVFA